MPDVTWDDIGDIKHRIRNSLIKATRIELEARVLREEIQGECDKLDDIVNKENVIKSESLHG